MPPRKRTGKRRPIALDARRMLALTIGPDPSPQAEADDVLVQVYAQHRDTLLRDEPPGRRPWAFWAYEPDVPDELRAERPALRPVGAPGRDRLELEERRRAWLAANPD